MPKGIVRAADRVAVWHDAAVPAFGEEEAKYGPGAPTSTPPVGDTPELAAPAVSKSKKFTAPANQLGKTLDTVQAPSNTELVTPHPAVKAHFDKYPDWTKSYVKPQYADMLKAHLGDENYQKMLYHMPEEHHDALHTHQQAPAPNSKKFTYPANQLKKLLDDPHTETSHVQDWLGTPYGAGFAKTYLKPGYADALKGHLGEKNYAELQNHLSAPEKAQEQDQGKSQFHQDLEQAAGHPFGEGWSDADDYNKEGLAGLIEHHTKNYSKDQLNALQGVYDKHFGQPQQGLGDKLKAVHEGFDSSMWNSSSPEVQKKTFQNWLQAAPHHYPPEKVQAAKDVFDEHFGQSSQDDPGSQHYQKLMKAVAPGSDAGKVMHTPAFKEWFHQKYPNADEDKKNATPSPSGLYKLFQKELGAQQVEQPQFSQQHQNLLHFTKGNANWAGLHEQTLKSPEFKQWFDAQSQHYQDKAVLSPSLTMNDFAAQSGQSSDQDEIGKIQEQMQPGGQQPPAAALQPGQEGMLDAWKKEHPDWQPEQHEEPEWLQGHPYASAWQQYQALPGEDPDDPQALQSDFEDWATHNGPFRPSQQQPGQKQQHEEPVAQDAPMSAALFNGIKKVFPGTGLDPYESQDQAKQQLESWLKYLPDHEGYAQHVPQLQALYDQHFGGQGGQQPSAQPEPEPLQDWEQELLDQNQPPQQQQSLGDALHYLTSPKGGSFMGPTWDGWTPEKQKEKLLDHINGGQEGPEKDQLEEIYKQYFGDLPGATPEHTFNPDESSENYHGEWQHNEASLPPGLKGYAEEHGVPLHSYAPWELQNLLDEGWAHLPPQKKQQYADAAKVEEGGPPQEQPSSSQFNANQFAQEMGKIFGISPNTIVGDIDKKSKLYKDMSPEEAQQTFNQLKQHFPEGTDVQGLQDKHFGGGGALQSSPGIDINTTKPDQAGLEKVFDTLWPGLGEIDKESWLHHMLSPNTKWNAAYFKETYPEEWAQVEQQFGQGGGALPGGGSSGASQQTSTGGGPPLTWLKEHFPDNSTVQAWTQPGVDAWWGAHKDKDPDSMPFFAQQWAEDAYGDKGQFGGQHQSATPIPHQSTPSVEALVGMGFTSGQAQGILDIGAQSLWENIDYVKKEIEGDDKYGYKDQPWGKIVQWAQQGSGQPQQPTQAPFDWDTFGPEFKALYPNSSWANTPQNEQAAEAKLKGAVEKANTDFAGTDKTKAVNALYQKYFPGGAPQGEDLNAFFNEHFGEPETPAEPAKPFKGEQLNPEDLTNWAANKPQSAADWKKFSQWWGDTQLSPTDEQGLYKSWFGKDAAPEQANQWFQSMFEHNSTPSDADLGSGHVPAWAHNSWAMGDKADAEWPAFAAWAQQHPGLPKSTSIKQKLQIWNGLSDEDKTQIVGDYAPSNPVDTKGVLKALKAAYPDSNWSKWSQMSQGTLAKNVQALAEKGYPGAIPVFNQFFGGDVAMPEETPPEEASGHPAAPSLPSVDSLPPWAQNQMVGKSPGQVEKLTKEFVGLSHFADSVGLGDTITGEDKPTEVGKPWNGLPSHLKAQVAQMSNPPWHDLAGFNEWVQAQPTVTDAIKQAVPGWSKENHYPWHTGSGYDAQKQQELGKLIAQADPETKQQLLAIQHQFFGTDKTTLAETLKEIDPDQDWDKLLQTKSPSAVGNLLKKQLKTEQDPVKWAQLANAWKKHFVHPEDGSDVAPSGMKGLTDYFKYKTPGKLDAGELSSLIKYKENNPNNETSWIGGHYGDPHPAAQALADADSGKTHLPFYGWTPPSGSTGALSYTPDPALLGKQDTTSYTAPAAEEQSSPQYKGLLTRADSMASGFFSTKDKATLNSDGFAHWFTKAPLAYRQKMQDHPGAALDDYDAFMSGGQSYQDVPDKPATGKEKFLDVSPFGMVPSKGKGNLPDSQTRNKKRLEDLKFPRHEDAQETLPLGPGERWAPQYAPLPIYRVMNLNLDHKPSVDRAPAHLKPKEKQLWVHQQSARLNRIDEILNGGAASRNPQDTLDHLKSWGSKYGLSDKEIGELSGVLVSSQPDLFTDEKWQHLSDFAKKQKAKGKEIPLDDLHELAKDLEVTPPAASKGSYDHPELGPLLLDYLENTGHRHEGGGESQGGLGWHWTRAINKIYKGVPDAGIGKDEMKASPRNVPIAISGLWGGQGEGGGHGGAYDPNHQGEKEHNLHTHAPVHIRRLQIRAPGTENQGYGAWHDTIDHGPMSLWGPGNYEEGDEKHRSDYAPGEMVGYKPSLTKELTKELGTPMPKNMDTLVPGHQADAVFTTLLHKYPAKKDQILKVYQEHFVGRPDLPAAHTRRASVQHIPRLAALDERNPAHLYDLATSWGVKSPERYGIPYLRGLASDLKGVAWTTKEMVKEHGLGKPNPRRGQPTVAAIEAALVRLADDDYDDYEDDSDYDDDHEYSDDDFLEPPLPTMDRPKGWPQQAPWLKNDPRGRQYFPPQGLNGPSDSSARPDIDWDERDHEQDPLPLSSDKTHLPTWDEWPHDVTPTAMYRGVMVDLNHKDLGPVRRALLGGEYESSQGAQAHPAGYDNRALGEHLLNHVQNNPKAYEGHQGYGLGPHWSLDEKTAQDFAKQTTMGSAGHPLKLPTVIRAQWKGLGEDPYRTHTQGDWPEENEVTMLPGATMNVDSVKVQHPQTKAWHEVLGQPTEKHAGVGDERAVFSQVALQNSRSAPPTNATSNQRHIASKVDVRRPRGILSHAEMRR